MGVLPCFVIYPLLRRWMYGARRLPAAVLGGAVSMLLGALAVVAETALSGGAGLDMRAFAGNMLGIHAAIGLGEGLITAALLAAYERASARSARCAQGGTLGLAAVTSGLLSLFASAHPDGLEWSLLKVAGADGYGNTSEAHTLLDQVQSATALLPDYALRAVEGALSTSAAGLIGCALVFTLALAAGTVLKESAARAAA